MKITKIEDLHCDAGWRRDLLALAATIIGGLFLMRWLFARPTASPRST